MSVLFVEIGCEEIPARLQVKAVADLRDSLCGRLVGLLSRAGAHGCQPASYGC